MGRPLKIAKAQAVITLTATNGTTEVVTTSANLNTLGIIAGMPFVTSANIGGLVAGTLYWILNVLSDTTFTVSATPLNANVNSTPVNLSTTSAQTVAATVAPVDMYFNNPTGPQWPSTNANTYSVVGGNTALYGSQVTGTVAFGVAGEGTITVEDDSVDIDGVGTDFANTLADGDIIYSSDGSVLGVIDDVANATANTATFAANASANYTGAFSTATPESGYIVRQKGKQKYLVKGTVTGIVGAVYTFDGSVGDQLANTIVIAATDASNVTSYVQSLSDRNIEMFTANSGPIATGNIVFQDADPAYATFNAAAVANAAAGQPYPIVTIDKA
jgi:hypothetical protein